ncbi:MAG: AI-2E family transporter [bacterium]|jgi:predicted PurR-regulated permease PerM
MDKTYRNKNFHKRPQNPRQSPWKRRDFDRHLWEIRAVRDVFWIAFIVGIIWLGYYLRGIFTPVLISLFLAYLFNPLINWMQTTWKIPRPVVISLILFVSFLLLTIFWVWFGPILADQVISLAKKVPYYIKAIAEVLPVMLKEFAAEHDINITSVSSQVDAVAQRVQRDPMSVIQTLLETTSRALGITTQAFGVLGDVISTTTYVVITIILIPVYFFFFAWHFDPMIRSLKKYIPASNREKFVNTVYRMDLAVSSFFRSRLIISIIMGFMFAIGWYFTNIQYWFLLGMITGLLSIIPYISIIAMPFAILLKYLQEVTPSDPGLVDLTQIEGQVKQTFDWMAVFVWPTVVYCVVQFIEGWFLTPWIQSRSTDLSAVTILVTLFVGGAVGGLYGLLLAIPIMACIKIFFIEFILPELERWANEH